MTESSTGWEECASEFFVEIGDILTPSRDEQLEMMTALVSADPEEAFVAVDLACGAGSLSGALLRRFPQCRVIALDGSPTMLATAEANLAEYADRLEFRQFDLRETEWLDALPDGVRCFVSSLAIHHLDGEEKRALFARLQSRLEPGGALLIVDLVEPVNERAWAAYAAAWDGVVREQSQAALGTMSAHERFMDESWNYFATPDLEFDKPDKLFDQLLWLRDAGFREVDCFWLRAGHAIYGGFC